MEGIVPEGVARLQAGPRCPIEVGGTPPVFLKEPVSIDPAVKKQPLARCIEATKTLAAGILLYRVWQFAQWKGIERGGHEWSVNAMERWQFETGLTPKQMRGAFDELRERNLIVTERHVFKNVIHVFARLVHSAPKGEIHFAPEGIISSAPEGTIEVAPCGTIGSAPEGEIMCKEELELELELELKLGGAKSANVPGEEKEETEEMLKLKSLSELIVLTGAEKASALLHKPVKDEKVSLAWKHGWAKAYPGMFSGLSGKELGQLRNFEKGCPAGTAPAILLWVLSDWITVAKSAVEMKGSKATPTMPDVGFLLYHRPQIVMLFQSKKEPEVQEAPEAIIAAEQVQVTAIQPTPVEPEPASKKLTWEELSAIIDKDD
jgi:hypothetical protein